MHVQHSRLVNSGYLGNCRGSERCFHLSIIFFFGVFSICLLIGLLVANVQYNAVKSQLTKDLQALNKTHISTITEKEELKTNLKKKSEELSVLSNKNSDYECVSNREAQSNLTERLNACQNSLSNITQERDQLNMRLIESSEEASGLQDLSEQNEFKCDLTEKVQLLDNLTACLQNSGEKMSDLSKEKELLNTKLGETTKELLSLCYLSENTTCPDGWEKHNCSCYNQFGPGTWDEGRADCVSKGGDLVVIDDRVEQDFLSGLYNDSWIGLSDKETEGSWQWVDGISRTFKFWISIQPDNGNGDPKWGEEDCAYISTNSDGSWNDSSCNDIRSWICEKISKISFQRF